MSRQSRGALPLLVLATLSFSAEAQKLATSGQFDVTSSGAAQFSIPIKVPAGTAGMQPNLALVYNSQKNADWQGPGWSLSGLSIITRCAKNLAQDGVREPLSNTVNDAYCLDGERLIPVNGKNGADGTEYRTLHDSFAKIISNGSYTAGISTKPDPATGGYTMVNGGPASFTVYTKAGLRMEFGNKDNAKVTSYQRGNPNFTAGTVTIGWGLGKVIDRAGNYMTITYKVPDPANDTINPPDAGLFQPIRIDYTGNSAAGLVPSSYVTIAWSNPTIQYNSGTAMPRAGTPVGITAYAGRATISYALDYDVNNNASLAPKYISATQCDPMAACLPPVKFGLEPEKSQFQFWTSDSAFPGLQKDYQHFFVDLNGDGRKYWLQISQASDDAWIGVAKPDATFSQDRWTKVAQPVGSLNNYAHYFADVNGDGKADWIRVSRNTNEAWVALGLGNGNFQFWSKYLTTAGAANNFGHFFADIDGDGRADWIQISRNSDSAAFALATGDGNFQFWSKTVAQYGLNNWDSQFVDINGDGKADWIVTKKSSAINGSGAIFNVSSGNGTFTTVSENPFYGDGTKYLFADINGDRQADMVVIKPDRSVHYALSKGDGNLTPLTFLNTSQGVDLLGDVNGGGGASYITMPPDSLSGSLMLTSGTNQIFTNQYNPIYPTLAARNEIGDIPPGGYQYFLADLNGDGKAEFIVLNNATKKTMIASSQFSTFAKIISLSNDQGMPTRISYSPLSDNTVITADTDAVYPLRNSAYPLSGKQRAPMVVSSVVSPNGIGGTLTTQYQYGGLRTDLSRQQVQGFRWMNETQLESGISNRTTYLQNWPFTGLIAQTDKTISAGGNGGLLSRTSNTWGCTDYVQTSGCSVAIGNRYATFLQQSVTSGWDLNGTALPVTTNSYQYDAFNNPVQVTNAISGGFNTVTTTTYNNDISKWWIGMPTKITVNKTTP